MPREIGGFGLTDLNDLAVAGEEKIDGATCFKIKGKHPRGSPLTIWVERERKLIRRIVKESQFATFRSRTTTSYRPQVNVPIASEDLAFKPPLETDSD